MNPGLCGITGHCLGELEWRVREYGYGEYEGAGEWSADSRVLNFTWREKPTVFTGWKRMSSHWEHRLYSQRDLGSSSSPSSNVMLNETLWASVLSPIKWDDNISYVEQSKHAQTPLTPCHLMQQWNIRAQSPQCRGPGWMPHGECSIERTLSLQCSACQQSRGMCQEDDLVRKEELTELTLHLLWWASSMLSYWITDRNRNPRSSIFISIQPAP